MFRRRKRNHTSAIKIATPATPPTVPPAIAAVLVDEAGFASPVLMVEDGVVFVVVGDEVTKVDGVELGVGIAVSH